MARRGAFARWPLQGNALEALREGRLEVGEGTLFEPQRVAHAAGRRQRVRIGAGSFLNIGVMVAAHELVEIGDHCMFANGCFVTDAVAPLRRPGQARHRGRASPPRAPRAWATTSGAAPTW